MKITTVRCCAYCHNAAKYLDFDYSAGLSAFYCNECAPDHIKADEQVLQLIQK
mgnify:CR=1 FL=1